MKTTSQVEKQKEKEFLTKENRLRDLQDNIKHIKLHIIGVSEEKRQKWAENLFEDIIIENFPNLRKETDIQVLEAQRVPNKMNTRRPTTQCRTKCQRLKIKNYKNSEKEANSSMQKTKNKNPKVYHLIFQEKLHRLEGSG